MKDFNDFIKNIDFDALITDSLSIFENPHNSMLPGDNETFALAKSLYLLKQYHLWLNQNEDA